MKSKADEEDYWNSSKFKAFTFDDEDDEFSRVRPEPGPGPFTGLHPETDHTVVSSGTLCLCRVSVLSVEGVEAGGEQHPPHGGGRRRRGRRGEGQLERRACRE